jgi:hypothetical protein
MVILCYRYSLFYLEARCVVLESYEYSFSSKSSKYRRGKTESDQSYLWSFCNLLQTLPTFPYFSPAFQPCPLRAQTLASEHLALCIHECPRCPQGGCKKVDRPLIISLRLDGYVEVAQILRICQEAIWTYVGTRLLLCHLAYTYQPMNITLYEGYVPPGGA